MYEFPGSSDRWWYRFFSLALFVVVGIFLINLYQNQSYLENKVSMLKADSRPIMVKNQEYTHARGDGGALPQAMLQPWAAVQAQAKDTVVQVCSQLVQIDFLEPYKTPAQGQSFASGFFINDHGELVTNAHAVMSAKSVWIQIPSLGKRIIDVDVVGVCPGRDLALLKVRDSDRAYIRQVLGKIPCLSLGDSDKVFRAEEILALGFPLAQHALKSTTGVVSGRELIGIQHYIQMSAPINPGSSGGPSLNRNGEVVGINTAGIQRAQNVGYIIPVNELKLILDDLRHVKLLRRPFLGVLHISGSESLARYLKNPAPGGPYVIEIYKNSLLDKAGVKSGDMIYEIDGNKIDMYGEMSVAWSEDKISIADYVSRLKLGKQVTIVVYRKGIRKEFSFTFDQSDIVPVRLIYPDYEAIDYEVIAGMVIMPLSLNHVAVLANVAPHLRKYHEAKEQQEPALILTHILPDSFAHRSRSLSLGSIISHVNGKEVKTLKDFRDVVKDGKHDEFLTIKTEQNLFVAFPLKEVLKKERQFARDYRYTISPLVKGLLGSMNEKKAS